MELLRADDDATTAIVGTVKFDGARPSRRLISLFGKDGKLSDCHELHKDGLLDENLIVGQKGQLANVFIYLKKGLAKQKYPIPDEPAILDQDHCMFHPRVQGVMVGQELLMRNSDPVIHNVRSLSLRNRAFNIGQPAKTPDRVRVFKKPEHKIKIQCDFHPWMTAYLFVMDHPYFAVTGEKGQFRIEGIPPGDYEIAAWHEELGEQVQRIAVAANSRTEFAISFRTNTRSENSSEPQSIKTTASIAEASAVSDVSPKTKRRFVKMWQTSDFADEPIDPSSDAVARGHQVFEVAACVKCHTVSGKGAKLGPDLTDVSKRFEGAKLIEQILMPSSEIHKEFQNAAAHAGRRPSCNWIGD